MHHKILGLDWNIKGVQQAHLSILDLNLENEEESDMTLVERLVF